MDAVGKPCASLVEENNPATLTQPLQPAREARFGPIVLKMRNETRRHDDVDRPVAKNLIGNMDLAAFCVACLGRVHTASLGQLGNLTLSARRFPVQGHKPSSSTTAWM